MSVQPPMTRARAPSPGRSAVPQNLPIAIGMVLASAWAIAANDAIAKLLSSDLPVIELVWARNFFYLVSFLPFILWKHGTHMFTPVNPGVQLLRSLLIFLANALAYFGISMMPLADAVALAFIYPCVVTAISPLFFAERVGPWRWGAVMLGFLGALIIIRPGSPATLSGGALFPLLSGLSYAVYVVLTRKVAGQNPPLVTFAITGSVGLAFSSGALPYFWVTPTLTQWALMAAIGLVTAIGHFLVILAYERAATSQLAPFHYMEVAASALFGLILFGLLPDMLTWAGIGIVVLAGVIIAWREGVARRDVPAPSVPAERAPAAPSRPHRPAPLATGRRTR